MDEVSLVLDVDGGDRAYERLVVGHHLEGDLLFSGFLGNLLHHEIHGQLFLVGVVFFVEYEIRIV